MRTPDEVTSLSVVVPVYNEESRLPVLLDFLERYGRDALPSTGVRIREAVVVDDGSTDATPRLLRTRVRFQLDLRVIRLERNRGKGAAVRVGMLAARGPLALLWDVDMSGRFDDVSTLAASLRDGFDIAIGSRALPASRIDVRQPRHRELLGKGFNIFARRLTGLPFRDTQCGFKLFDLTTTRRIFELQRLDGFAYDVELLILAEKLGLRVAEVPVCWSNDARTTVGARQTVRMGIDLVRLARLARQHVGVRASAASVR